MVFWNSKKDLIKLFKKTSCKRGFAKDCLEVYKNCTYLFPILLQIKQKPITNSCRNNLWSKPILILSKKVFKILRKKPGDKAFRFSFKLPKHG